MRVKGLNGREYSWKLTGRSLRKGEQKGSSYHARARKLIHSIFPNESLLEEVPLPGSGKLTGDFFLPTRKLMVEVHGEQHYRFIIHFHRTPLGFLQSKQRDQQKVDWCELNSIRHVELPYSETDDEWKRRILGREETDAGGGSGD